MTEDTTEQAIDPKLVLKIKKMLALSKGGTTEGEADNAAKMAQRLMMENNISMAQVDSIGGETQEGGKRSKQRRKGNAMYKFQQTLMAACADVNFVYQEVRYEYTNGHRRAKGYTLIGREANVVATQVLFDYLASTCENLGIEYVDHDNRRRMSIEALSFKEGVADRVAERLRTRHEQQIAAQKKEARERNAAARHPSAAGTALVVVMEDYEQAERDRNNDIRLGKPDGYTAQRRLMQSRDAEINQAVDDAVTAGLRQHHGCTDRDLLAELAEAIFAALLAERGWQADDELVAKAKRTTLRWEVDRVLRIGQEQERRAGLTDAQRAKEDAQRQKEADAYWARRERSSAGPQRNIDSRAYRAGSAAGERVGLDKQVDAEARAKLK